MSKRMPSFVDLAHRTAVTGLVGLGVSFNVIFLLCPLSEARLQL